MKKWLFDFKYQTMALIMLGTGLISCQQRQVVDQLIVAERIYVVDENFNHGTAMVVHHGRIVEVGDSLRLLEKYRPTETVEFSGRYLYPGFHDPHCHYYGYAMSKRNANLVGTASWEEVLERIQQHAAEHPDGWLLGRGWDQNDWPVKRFPNKSELSRLFPDRPVLLTRIDGHAAIANDAALRIAGISGPTTVDGGIVEVSFNGPTGMLIDAAISLVASHIPEVSSEQVTAMLLEAERDLQAVGLVSVGDAGLPLDVILRIDELQQRGELRLRVFAMHSPDEANYDFIEQNGVYETDRLRAAAVKLYSDGALGSRGAWLLRDYSDDPGNTGISTVDSAAFERAAEICLRHGLQLCIHAIGDRANREMLDFFSRHLEPNNDRRWRIEHAQIVHRNDWARFGSLGVLPSMQTTHCTSDMPWAPQRLGEDRIHEAYPFRTLMQSAGVILNGSDFPVEDINPLLGFYAAVTTKQPDGTPAEGFRPRETLTREQALRAMTIWAAFGQFQEHKLGSLEAGKQADYTVLDKDILMVSEGEILSAQVEAVGIAGEVVFERSTKNAE